MTIPLGRRAFREILTVQEESGCARPPSLSVPSCKPMLLLLLDSYHLGDPLFLTGLARDLAARRGGLVLVHGSGERGERALEAQGLVPTLADGVWVVETEREAATVERAVRELNREIAHELNEAGVASVRVVGADRGLLKSAEGGVRAGRTQWLADLVGQGVVPVVAALVGGKGGPLREVDAGRAAAALARSLDVPLAILTRRTLDAEGGPASLADAAVRSALAAPEAAERAVEAGAEVVATGRGALREAGAPRGRALVR